MIINILIFLLSIIPSVLIIVRLRDRKKDEPIYREDCKSAAVKGFFSVLPILGVSALIASSNAILKATVLKGAPVLFTEAIHTFLVLAFAEELVKFLMLKNVLKKSEYAYTWADVTAYMVIIGTAFGLIEDVPYAIGASPMVMLVRGFTMGHVGYGFMMGWFYGKKLYTGDKKYGVLAFMLPFLLHGIYDYSLTPELLKVNELFTLLALSLAVIDIVLLVLMIRFFIRSKKIERYNEPLVKAIQSENSSTASEEPMSE